MILHNIHLTSNRFLSLTHLFCIITAILCLVTLFSAGVGAGEKEAFMYLNLEDLVVRTAGDKIEISGDPAVLNDLSVVLSRLVDLTKYLKKKAEFIRAEKRAADPVDRAKREAAFDARSRDVFCAYERHLHNGCGGNKAMALKVTRQELGLMACDAKILVAQGRRLEKNRRMV
jgi:ribosomal protein L7/L12